MRNKITVTATHPGYISIWLSGKRTSDHNWESTDEITHLELEQEDGASLKETYYIENANTPTEISFTVPTLNVNPGEERVLRVKYAVHESDLATPTNNAITGEVEDYIVTMQTGMDVTFGDGEESIDTYKPVDYGVPCEQDGKSLGDRDGYYAPEEIIEHTITVKNYVGEEQLDRKLTFKSNLNTLVENGYGAGQPFKIITDEGSGEIQEIKSKEDYKYEIIFSKIGKHRKLTFKVKFKITNEDFVKATNSEDYGKSFIKDKLIYDEADPDVDNPIPELRHRVSKHQMIQDYGNNFVKGYDATNDARHYVTSGLTQALWTHPAHLGGFVIGEKDGPDINAQDDNGVSFETIKGEAGTENVVYNKLINHIQVSATHKGYINAWLTKKDNPNWSEAIPLQLRLNRDIVPPIGSTDGKNIPLLIETGKNDVYFNLEDIMEDAHTPEDRVIRIRYTIDSADITEPTGMAKTGEVEDYKVKLISGLDVKFGTFEDTNEYKLLDLGIPCEVDEHSGSSLGARDGYYAPTEIVEHTISIKNLSKVKQYNKEFYFNSNLLDKTRDIVDFEITSETKNNGKIEEIVQNYQVPLVRTTGTSKYQYKIIVQEIEPEKEITLKVRFKIAGEALETENGITKSMIRDYLVIDEVDPFEYDPTIKKRIHNQEMKQDLGDNLMGSYELTNDARHYITTGMTRAAWTHPARLGMDILPEEKPEISSDNDGVVFDKRTINNNEVNVIYNDMRNEITIKATHKGYVSAWLSKGRGANYSWNDAIPLQLKLDTDAETQSTDTNVTPLVIEAGEKIVAFDLDDVLADSGTSEERVIRVRYSPISEEEVKEPIGMATAGEVEDYPVVVMKGSRVKFGKHDEEKGYKPLDLGVIYKDNGDNNIYMGAQDGYYALNEIIEHTITVYNETNQHQEYQDILLDTNILGEFVEINPDDIDYVESIQGIQPLNLSDNNIQYTIRVKDIPPRVNGVDGYRTVRVRLKVTKENLETGEYKYHIKDRVITIDEEQLPAYVPFDKDDQVSLVEMERDYGEKGEGFFEKAEDENVARHYIISSSTNSEKTPAHLGATIIPEDKPQSSTDNDGVIFNEINTRAKTNGEVENILFNELVNALEITTNSEIGGYITLWLSNEDASDWSTAENLSIIVGDEKEETSTTKVYKIAKGKNRVRFELPKLELDPELHEARRVLRVRFALDADDVKTSIGMAKTGEVEDYQVVIKEGLDVKFGEFDKEDANEYKLLDLGIPCKVHTSNSLGERDGYYAPTEIVEHTISIKNLSNDPQTDKEFYLYSNLLDIQEKAEGSLDYEIITDEANG
uniref:GEVED domain-containing protein n=1 Tax=Fusobacterium mortiferum TaxID=850 RepID=UPI003FF11234